MTAVNHCSCLCSVLMTVVSHWYITNWRIDKPPVSECFNSGVHSPSDRAIIVIEQVHGYDPCLCMEDNEGQIYQDPGDLFPFGNEPQGRQPMESVPLLSSCAPLGISMSDPLWLRCHPRMNNKILSLTLYLTTRSFDVHCCLLASCSI